MASNKIRIMAGKWKGRNITFPSVDNLRPTGSRIRETLFNWLQGPIINATCLDLFSGSGILSFEALSRGANKVLAVDASAQVIQRIQEQAKALDSAPTLLTLQHNAYELTQYPPARWQTSYSNYIISGYDIIFIDPPFADGNLSELCAALTQHHWLKKNSLIYVEKNKKQNFIAPEAWQLLKNKVAGEVSYQLYKCRGSASGKSELSPV